VCREEREEREGRRGSKGKGGREEREGSDGGSGIEFEKLKEMRADQELSSQCKSRPLSHVLV